MLFIDEDQTSENFDKVRKVELKDGQVITLRREDPFGLVRIGFKNGRIPDSLSGSFTSFPEAEKAVRIYIGSKGKEAV